MSGPVPMSPGTAPDSTVSQGSAASAPAGIVSGNEGAVHAGTTPVYHMGDPLQGSGDPWASTTPWLSFSPGVSSAALPSTPIGLPSQSSPGGSGKSGNTATFGMPPGFLDPGPTQAPTPAVDPVMAQLLRQQMLLTQGVMDLLNRSGPGLPQQQQPVQQTPTVAQSSTAQSERLTMDTKWIPAAPLPDWKSWNNRAKELAGKFASWLCLVHDSYGQELKEAMNLPYPVVTVNQDQAIRSRRLFHLLQQSFSGYSRVDNVVKSQIAFYGIQEANGFELLRLLRREFSLMSRPEALQYREACLKYTVKKSERHLLMDVLREIGAEIEGFHSMLEASLIAGQLTDLRITEGGSIPSLPEKLARQGSRVCAASLWCNNSGQSLGVCGGIPHTYETHQRPGQQGACGYRAKAGL